MTVYLSRIMGCLFGKQSRQDSPAAAANMAAEEPKKYSWDTRPRVDPKDFTFQDLKGETVAKLPGTINGQQFIIKDCEGSDMYIFDHSATVTVDDCTNCRIFIGPIKSSIFIRDCKNCKFMIACQQFRTRDCQKLEVYLSCVTQPIIEATTGVKFGCFQWNYLGLEDHFQKATISPYNNIWSNIHDFTPVSEETNFSLVSPDSNINEQFPIPTAEQFASLEISTNNCPVPKTFGKRQKPSEQSCLVVFFSDGNATERAKKFMQEMKNSHSECVLVQSKEIKMSVDDGQRVFGTDSYASALQQGPVIGFEFNGDGVCQSCQDVGVTVGQGSTGVIFISAGPEAAATQVDNFYSFADMQMGV